MGNCCKGDSSSEESKPNLILKYTGIQAVDELFRSASSPLSTLSGVSDSLGNAVTAFKTSTYTQILTDYTVADSLYGMLYIFSANIENVINHVAFKLTNDSPYIALDKSKLPQHVLKIYENWEALVNALEDTPNKLEYLQPQIETLAEEAKEFPSRAKDICTHNSLGAMESFRACQDVAENTKKIVKAKTVLVETGDMVKMMLKSIQQFCVTFQENAYKVEGVGKSAREEKLLMPKEVVLKLWPEQERIDRAAVAKEEEKERKEREESKGDEETKGGGDS